MPVNNKRQLSKGSIAYIALGIVLIAVMTVAGMSAFLRTTDFVVEGTSIYSVEEVVEASGLSVGANLMFVNTQNAIQNIRSELPFVSAVEITRKLPDTVHIQITESVAVAYIFFAGDYYIIDSTGRVLERSRGGDGSITIANINDLVEIRGVEIEETDPGSMLKPVFGTETKLQYMEDVLTGLEREELINDVSYLDVSNIVNVHFGYLNLYRVILGGSTNLRPSNLRHTLSILPDSVRQVTEAHPNTAGDLDMSDESGSPKFTLR